MGASSSKDTELDEVLAKFSEEEQTRLNKLFDSQASETLLDKAVFRTWASKYFPDTISERIFDFIKQISNNNEQTVTTTTNQADKREFLLGILPLLRGSLSERAQAFLFLACNDKKVDITGVSEFCSVLVENYIKAIQGSGYTSTRHGQFREHDCENDKRLPEMLLSSLPKESSTDLTETDIENWFKNEVLVVRIFEDVFKACFLGADIIVETHWHGLEQGCEPTVEHVEKKKDILLPCKLNFQGHNIQTLLDISSMLMLNHAVPSECRHIWRLLYATSCHGKSFTTFLHRLVYQGPTILLVKDQHGEVFGGFASTSWKVKSCFTGDVNCFLFKLEPSMSIYHPTGINDHFMYLNVGMQTIPNGLGMGGQFEYFGLWLDHEFGPGHSKARPKCTTYGSPRLSGSEEFQVEEVEVWGVGVPPEKEEKERSVLDRETDAQAILDLIGKERKSDGFREPEDSD